MEAVEINIPLAAETPTIDYVKKMGRKTVTETYLDEFSQDAQVVREFSGIEDTGFKRRITNQINKAYTGAGRTKSARIDESDLTGYDIFGVIQPPYNLYSFTKVYEMNSPHYAAVNAKVSNIVGLGFNFVQTRKTQRALEKATKDAPEPKVDKETGEKKKVENKKLTRLRDALDEHKDDLFEQLESFNYEDGFVEVLTKVWRDYEVTGNGYIEIDRGGR